MSSYIFLFKIFSLKKILLMFLPTRLYNMFDSTTIELHLIHNSLCISHDTIGIFTIKTIKFLPKSKPCKLVSIKYYIIFSVYERDFKNTKIDVLKLIEKNIHQ